MKKQIIIFLTIVLSFYGNKISAQTYYPVNDGSVVTFIIRNMGMDTEGKMSGLGGEIRFNPADLKNSSFSVSIDANTIDTDISVRDSSLKTKEYLNTRQFPEILFISRQIIPGNKAGMYSVKGTLTMKGISKDINFPFSVTPQNEGIRLTGEFRVNRLDYQIGMGSVVLSNNLTVFLSVFAKKT